MNLLIKALNLLLLVYAALFALPVLAFLALLLVATLPVTLTKAAARHSLYLIRRPSD